MTAWLIYDAPGAERNREYIQFYIDEGKHRNIDIKLVSSENMSFPLISRPDFAIVRTMNPALSKKLERQVDFDRI